MFVFTQLKKKYGKNDKEAMYVKRSNRDFDLYKNYEKFNNFFWLSITVLSVALRMLFSMIQVGALIQ